MRVCAGASDLDLLYKPRPVSRPGEVSRLVIVSNRVPVPSATGVPAAGGVAIALKAALRSKGGLWFGWSGKTARHISPEPQVRMQGMVSFAVSDLTRRDLDEFYHGFANRALWPICHYRLDLARLSDRDAEGYFRVNETFARRLAKMLRANDIVWVHDYHFIPMASFLRRLGVRNRIGYFHHIPWPSHDIAAAMPGYARLLRAFAAYDVAGFQTAADGDNLRDCLVQSGAGRVLDDRWCECLSRKFEVGVFPIGIDAEAFALEAGLAERNILVKRMRASLEGRAMIIGVDRLDYSKGIGHRLDAFAACLERYPAVARARATLLQITPKSRSEIPEYSQVQNGVAERVGHINGRHGDVGWTPVRYVNKTMSQPALAGLYRLARVGLVTPLRDGMNLVAKEYVAAQSPDDPGALVLSQFAGAARELKAALIVNPYDIEATAAAIARAVAMPLDERKDRWRDCMAALRANSIDHWTAACLGAIGGEVKSETESSLYPAGSMVRSGVIANAEPWLAAAPVLSSLGN